MNDAYDLSAVSPQTRTTYLLFDACFVTWLCVFIRLHWSHTSALFLDKYWGIVKVNILETLDLTETFALIGP